MSEEFTQQLKDKTPGVDIDKMLLIEVQVSQGLDEIRLP
jgi:hypothetical protein